MLSIKEELRNSVMERFEKYVVRNKANACFGWLGRSTGKGLPKLWVNGKSIGINRIAWILFKGSIKKGYFVIQTCGNKLCTNPNHLILAESKTRKKSNTARQGRKRVSIDLPENTVNSLIKVIKKRNTTMTKYIYVLILNALSKER